MTDEPQLIDVELLRLDGSTFFRADVPEAAGADPRDRRGIEMGRAVIAAIEAGDRAFVGLALRGVQLSKSDLRCSSFRHSYLVRADLRGAEADGCSFEGADLSTADLSNMKAPYEFTNAKLSHAKLFGVDLYGCDLSRTDLRSADVTGARFGKDTLKRHIASVDRSDGYTFHAFELEDGTMKVAAGCRWFTVDEYEAHIAERYPNTSLADETLAILEFLDTRWRQLK
jgi:uncharacterized protein YjbI with pentapeptide repeats